MYDFHVLKNFQDQDNLVSNFHNLVTLFFSTFNKKQKISSYILNC